MKKIILGLLLIVGFAHGQTKIKYNQFQSNFGNNTTFLGSTDNTSLLFKTNGTQRLKIDSLGNYLFNTNSIGSSTLSSFRLVKGTATVDIGQYSTGLPAMWFSQATPSTANYAFLFAGNTYYNATSSGSHYFSTNGGGDYAKIGTNSYFTGLTRIGSNATPTAALDVTGTMSVSSTATIAGAVRASTIDATASELVLNATTDIAVKVNSVTTFACYSGEIFHIGKNTMGSAATPNAKVQIAAGTTAANNAPLKFTLSGSSILTTPEAGVMEINSSGVLYYSPAASTRYLVGMSLVGSATLDFGNTAAGAVSDLTVAVTGAAAGDVVSVGVPNGSMPAAGTYFAWVSAANVVSVRFANNALVTAYDPASGTFKVTVNKN